MTKQTGLLLTFYLGTLIIGLICGAYKLGFILMLGYASIFAVSYLLIADVFKTGDQ